MLEMLSENFRFLFRGAVNTFVLSLAAMVISVAIGMVLGLMRLVPYRMGADPWPWFTWKSGAVCR